MRRHKLSLVLLVALVVGGLVPAAADATPVAKTKEEWELYGRVFLEPTRSVDHIQFDSEFAPAMKLLEKLYPRYIEFTTIADELKDKNAVSVGNDGVPAWHPEDTGDGLPLHMAIATDEKVPDKNKAYVFLTNAHAAEPCGREGGLRFLEDLAIWATTEPNHVLEDGTGTTGKTHRIPVRELLAQTKIYFVNTAADGWAAGDTPGSYSQSNGGGYNSNRLVWHDGWNFPDDPGIRRNGYSSLTQPEGAAVAKYFMQVRKKELNGRPFAAAADMHGPLPVGAVLLHDQGNTPLKLERTHDFAERIEEKMDAVLARYITEPGQEVHEVAADQVGRVRDQVLRLYGEHVGPVSEKALFLTLEWAEYATVWDHLDYTVTGTWGGWAGSEGGLGADSISYEVDCLVYVPYNGELQQLFVDNIRAILETTVVHAAFKDRFDQKPVNLKSSLGFYDSGARITDRDGNPSPPPKGPRNPIWGPVVQAPYNVANTDYFRDLKEIVSSPVNEVPTYALKRGALDGLGTFVVADTIAPEAARIKEFVRAGGKLVLTDSALKMLPDLIGVSDSAVQRWHSYVGYADIDREHPFAKGLYDRARQTYDPVGLGYPLLMERDQYWPCDTITGECEESSTENGSAIWTVDRAEWEDAGGVTVATADPPEDPHGGAEGFETNKTEIGTLKLGKGRIVIFGALLPQPTESYPHWFGLNPYTISLTGQTMLLNALEAR